MIDFIMYFHMYFKDTEISSSPTYSSAVLSSPALVFQEQFFCFQVFFFLI